MKNFVLVLTLLISTSSFAIGSSKNHVSYCEGRGQEAIDSHKEMILVGIARGEISDSLGDFFIRGTQEMQRNYDYLCKGIRISAKPRLTAREKQLSLVLDGIASGEIDDELADFFLENLRD